VALKIIFLPPDPQGPFPSIALVKVAFSLWILKSTALTGYFWGRVKQYPGIAQRGEHESFVNHRNASNSSLRCVDMLRLRAGGQARGEFFAADTPRGIGRRAVSARR